MMDYNLLVGIVGMVCILVAFVLDEFNKRFDQDTYFYNVLNILGAGLLLYYGLTLKGWPFVILNAIWVIAAAVKVVKIALKR